LPTPRTDEAVVTPVTRSKERWRYKNERLRSTQPFISLFPILKQAEALAALMATTFALQPAQESTSGAFCSPPTLPLGESCTAFGAGRRQEIHLFTDEQWRHVLENEAHKALCYVCNLVRFAHAEPNWAQYEQQVETFLPAALVLGFPRSAGRGKAFCGGS